MDTTSISALPTGNGVNMQPQGAPIQQGAPMQQQGAPMQQQGAPMQQQGASMQVNTAPNSGYNPNVSEPVRPPPTLSKDMMQEISNTIQNASADGSTQLPSRDIPRETLHLATDVQVNADHVPLEEKMRDYIGDYDDTQAVIQKHIEEKAKYDQLESLYNEIQSPVLIMLLYFMFQLPVVNSMVFKVFPKLFHKDGNLNISGLLLKTSLYGASYYGIMKGISYI